MVSQFISSHDVPLLNSLQYNFPPGTHAIGRLDQNSEGLLILTTNKKVTRLLFSGELAHKRVYLVQVNNTFSSDSLNKIKSGVLIPVKAGEMYNASCEASIVSEPDKLYNVELQTKKWGDHTWLKLELTEGKFRQVRKMIAAVNHRCKRLIRISIENIHLDNLKPGEVREMQEEEFFRLLNIKYPV